MEQPELAAPRKRAISHADAMALASGTVGRQYRIAHEELTEIEQHADSERSPFLGRVKGCAREAFGNAVSLIASSRPGGALLPDQFIAHTVRLRVMLDRMDELAADAQWSQVKSRWPRKEARAFTWKAGANALETALEVANSVERTVWGSKSGGTGIALGRAPRTKNRPSVPSYLLLPIDDPKVAAWRDAALSELASDTFPASEWSVGKIERERALIEKWLDDEYQRAIAPPKRNPPAAGIHDPSCEPWRSELMHARDRFREMGTRHFPALDAVVVEWSTTNPVGENQWPVNESFDRCVWSHGSEYRPFIQRVDAKGRPLFTDKPKLDVNGTPIVNSAGEAFDVLMPAIRSVTLYTGQSVWSTSANDALRPLADAAEQAGRAIEALLKSVWQEYIAPETMRTKDAALRWMYVVFDLAWRGVPGTLLRADKRIWKRTPKGGLFFVRVAELPLQRALYAHQSSGSTERFIDVPGYGTVAAPPAEPDGTGPLAAIGELVAETPDPPDRWYSELKDIASCSAAAADFILRVGTGTVESQRNVSAENRAPAMTKEAKAIAVLVDHPDWTDDKIAEAAGCNRSSLYRMKKYQQARKAQKSARVLKGSKSKSGEVEAWEDD